MNHILTGLGTLVKPAIRAQLGTRRVVFVHPLDAPQDHGRFITIMDLARDWVEHRQPVQFICLRHNQLHVVIHLCMLCEAFLVFGS